MKRRICVQRRCLRADLCALLFKLIPAVMALIMSFRHLRNFGCLLLLRCEGCIVFILTEMFSLWLLESANRSGNWFREKSGPKLEFSRGAEKASQSYRVFFGCDNRIYPNRRFYLICLLFVFAFGCLRGEGNVFVNERNCVCEFINIVFSTFIRWILIRGRYIQLRILLLGIVKFMLIV